MRDRGAVRVGNFHSLDDALRAFKKQIAAAGIMGVLRSHAAHLSPGVRRRLKAQRARQRRRRAAARAVTGRPSRA